MRQMILMILIVAVGTRSAASASGGTRSVASASGGTRSVASAKIEKLKIKAEKTKPGKKETREFPLMFDIVDKAAKHKAKKAKKGDK